MTRWKTLPGLTPKRRHYEEDELQIKIVYRLKLEFDPQDLLFTHPANGGKRSKAQAAKFKAMGQKAGIMDLLFWWPEKVLHGDTEVFTGRLNCGFIELKATKGILSDHQKELRDLILSWGGKWALCRSYDSVKDTLIGWGVKCRV